MIYTLLSLPPDFAESFETIFSSSRNQIFASSDPKGTHLGSGGGTAWILSQFNKSTSSIGIKKILIHAGVFFQPHLRVVFFVEFSFVAAKKPFDNDITLAFKRLFVLIGNHGC